MSSEVSAVYANALFSLASEQGNQVLQQTRADLRQCALMFRLNPDLTRLLSLPTLSVEERMDIARKIFGEEGLAVRLLLLLIDHKRIGYLGEIADVFDNRMLDYEDTVQVKVTTAIPLTPEQLDKLAAALQAKLGKTVRITERIDKSILGGVIVKYGDTRIDNSLKYRLESIKAQLT